MHYELTYIISALVPETEHSKCQDEVLAFLHKAKAEILSGPTNLGRKKLAYPILKQKHGFYVVLEFNLEDRQTLQALETSLRHDKNILRHLVIKKRILNSINSEKNFADVEKKPSAPKKFDNRSSRASRPNTVKTSVKKAEPAKKEAAKPEVDLSSLDQQLDQILSKEQ